MTRAAQAVAGFFHEQRDAYLLGLLRLALSALLFIQGGRLLLEFSHAGYFRDFFHLPLIPESWLPQRSTYLLLLALQALATVLAFVGVWPREALLLASSLGLYVLACDRLQYHNNRYALLLLGWLLAFTPCDRSFLLTRGASHALPSAARRAPTFARRLFQIQVSLVYLGSTLGKLLDPDWRGGQVLLMRFAKSAPYLAQHGLSLPSWLDASLSSPLFASVAAKIAIGSELFIALGAWQPRTRRLALWAGLLFHIGIELSARVELFSWLMVASYLAFVTPELRERRLELDRKRTLGAALARLVPLLDWCARFEVRPLPPDEPEHGAFYVTNRAGQRAGGLAGAALLSEALPLLFPLWLPLALLARLSRTRASAS